jgi:hypothetical protein
MLLLAWLNRPFDETTNDFARNATRPVSLPLFQRTRNFIAKTLQSLQLILRFAEMTLQRLNHLLARTVTTFAKPQNTDYFLKREPEMFRLPDELESSKIGVGVDPIACLGPRRLGQQTLPLIEADGLHGHSSLFGHISDLHRNTLNPEVNFRVKRYSAWSD